MKRCTVLSALLALVLASAAGADWPQFRGPGGSGTSAEKGLPAEWGPDSGLRWKVALPGRGLSNPVIARGRCFVTASSEYREKRLHVLCYDVKTGKKLWERQLHATGGTTCHPKTCMAAPTPVTDGENVYALFATGDLAAFDRDGRLLWYRSLVGDYPNITNQVGMAASPALAGGVLLLPMENAGESFAAGIDTKTGRNRWKAKRVSEINWVSPLVVKEGGRSVALFQTSKDVTAYDPATGDVRWAFTGPRLSDVRSATAGGGLVYVAGGKLLALKPGPDGTTPKVVWESPKMRAAYASPLYHQGRIYGVNDVTATALDAKTGESLWQHRVDMPVAASPVLGDGKLYVTSEKGNTTVIDITDPKGKVLARNRLYPEGKGEVPSEDRIQATPALADGAIFLRSDRTLFCIGVKR